MVEAYHLVITTYGFWLPNDPRGSWSEFVASWELFRKYGPATKVDTPRSLARVPHNRKVRLEAKQSLKYPVVSFSGVQARAVGHGFDEYVSKTGLTVWACSILPEHVHMVIARHRYGIEQVANLLKGSATTQLFEEDLHPFAAMKDHTGKVPKCWGRGEWKVFLEGEEAIRRAIRYVQENPLKEGKPRQRWSFVVPYPRRFSRDPTGERGQYHEMIDDIDHG